MSGVARAFTWITFILAGLIVVGVFFQAYSITAYVTGEPDALDLHGAIGGIVHGLEILAWIAAIVAYWRNWKEIAFTFLLPLLGTVQIFLAPPDDTADRSSGWVHGFHGFMALVVLVLAAIVAHRAMRRLGLGKHGDAAPAA